jgi:CRISPR/Cas system-associated endonuclease Cas1
MFTSFFPNTPHPPYLYGPQKTKRMSPQQEQKVKELIQKYNDILLNSMRLAVAEDFINLIILNRDDADFELNECLQNKNEYYNHIFKEFMKQNSSSVIDELKTMEDPLKELKRKFGTQGAGLEK